MTHFKIVWAGAFRSVAATALALAFVGADIGVVSGQTLLLRYTFDEADSGSADAVDSGGAPPAPGLFVGATRIANTPGGFSKGAIDLTGAAAGNLKYVHGGDAAKLDGLETFTLTAWINVQGVPTGNRRIVAKQGGGSFPGFSWNVNDPDPAAGARSASSFGLRLFVGGENGFQHDLGEPRVTVDADKKWVFVAVTYDGRLAAENVKYYVGSVNEPATNQVTTTINAGKTLDTDARFTIGHTDAALTSNTALQGWIDDVRVYSGVLSAPQLDAVRLENLPQANPPKGVTLVNPSRAGGNFSFAFQSQSGRSHRVQSKNDLAATAWQTLATLSGAGQTLTFTDNTASAGARFYRVTTE